MLLHSTDSSLNADLDFYSTDKYVTLALTWLMSVSHCQYTSLNDNQHPPDSRVTQWEIPLWSSSKWEQRTRAGSDCLVQAWSRHNEDDLSQC